MVHPSRKVLGANVLAHEGPAIPSPDAGIKVFFLTFNSLNILT